MLAVKEARKFIEAHPQEPAAKIFSALVIALESDGDFPLRDLYSLSYAHFELALKILAEWRLDRHYTSKIRLLDVSVQMSEMATPKS